MQPSTTSASSDPVKAPDQAETSGQTNTPNQAGTSLHAPALPWPSWQKWLFRFFFIYFALQLQPWTWISAIPGVGYLLGWYGTVMDWAVDFANKHLFHVRPQLVPLNGSGDTSYGWTQLWLFLLLSAAGCLIWSILDRRRHSYNTLNYWLRIALRYYIAMIAFVYGIEKVYALQMPFPNLSQLATPLGDFLPMRLSWMFIGYSQPYQVFSGVMEVLAGLLLLYRRTATLGAMVAAGVFINVMMLNLSYDIPVKIFSMQMVFCCIFLLAMDYKRLLAFLVFNQPTTRNTAYDRYPKKGRRPRIIRIILKSVFIIIALVMPFFDMQEYYRSVHKPWKDGPIRTGVYDVSIFALNKDTIPSSLSDTIRWKDIIFDRDGVGSIGSRDSLFRKRYGRAYFYYQSDSARPVIVIKKSQADSIALFRLRYEIADSNTIRCWTRLRNDSLYLLLKKTDRHFQLAERQFHWLSEYNR